MYQLRAAPRGVRQLRAAAKTRERDSFGKRRKRDSPARERAGCGLRLLCARSRRCTMASPALASEAFAPYRLREGTRPEEALAEVRVALARREVQLASLLDIIRQMEGEVHRVRG